MRASFLIHTTRSSLSLMVLLIAWKFFPWAVVHRVTDGHSFVVLVCPFSDFLWFALLSGVFIPIGHLVDLNCWVYQCVCFPLLLCIPANCNTQLSSDGAATMKSNLAAIHTTYLPTYLAKEIASAERTSPILKSVTNILARRHHVEFLEIFWIGVESRLITCSLPYKR